MERQVRCAPFTAGFSKGLIVSLASLGRVGGAVAAALALASAGWGIGTTPMSNPSEVSARALLNWEKSSIQLPLDEYGMNSRGAQIVLAAQSVLIWQCLTATPLSDMALSDARAMVSFDPNERNWLYGVWDAPYVAAHGTEPRVGPVLNWLREWDPADQSAVEQCGSDVVASGMNVIDRRTVGSASDAPSLTLLRQGLDAYHLTVQDSRFKVLVETLNACIQKAGYKVADGSIGGVELDPTWDDNQSTRAYLTWAQCSDDMGFTQQAGDIEAGYEAQAILNHQAELVEVKQIADGRVTQATQILTDAGVL
ncbi:MAG: hypothetical protein FWF36_04740 [Propionibacteriaceae bacterium]|nr:hypothetical protein [Propionibacteriaceae bacterium]